MNIDSENTMRFVRRNMATVKNKLLNKHSEAENHFVHQIKWYPRRTFNLLNICLL